MLRFLIRRLAFSVAVVVIVAILAYGGMRILRPEVYGPDVIGGTLLDLEALFLHFDFPSKHLWSDGALADVVLLALGFAVGVTVGVAGGVWCALRPRSLAARAAEWLAMVALCAPVYIVGLGLLLLFEPTFGAFPVPVIFEAHRYADPGEDLGRFVTSMIIPALVLGAPIAGGALRLTQAMILEHLAEDYVRTAQAKGLSAHRVVRRHAAPTAYVPVAGLVAASVPMMVTNAVFVEIVFSIQGALRHVRDALGQTPGTEGAPQLEVLQILGVWSAVLVVSFGLLVDLALVRLDPRIRSGDRE